MGRWGSVIVHEPGEQVSDKEKRTSGRLECAECDPALGIEQASGREVAELKEGEAAIRSSTPP